LWEVDEAVFIQRVVALLWAGMGHDRLTLADGPLMALLPSGPID
jgi:hypothetical protein